MMVEVDGLIRRPVNQDPTTRQEYQSIVPGPGRAGLRASTSPAIWFIPLSKLEATQGILAVHEAQQHPCLLPAPSTLHRPPFTVLRSSQQHLHLSDTAPRFACFGITTAALRLPSSVQCQGQVGSSSVLTDVLVCLLLSSSVRMNPGTPSSPLLRVASMSRTKWSDRGCLLFSPLTLPNHASLR